MHILIFKSLHVIQSSDCKIWILINRLPIYLSTHLQRLKGMQCSKLQGMKGLPIPFASWKVFLLVKNGI